MKISDENLEIIQQKLKEVRDLGVQLHKEDKRRSRNQYKRDYTRVIYSSSFRRLQGKMQLLGVQVDKFYRNRLTHSLEVSQIARAIAERLNYESNEIYVVEACSLAHDLGNPPFGHYGERVLNELSKDIGGFEGNAQTLRVLTELEKKNPDSKGLNLTLRTLLGVTKYFVKYQSGIKKFIYEDTYEMLLSAMSNKNVTVRTIDVQVIDIADEIAYAAHDLEDALSLKLFSVDELLFEFERWVTKNSFSKENSFGILKNCVEKARHFAEKSINYHSSEEYSFLFRKELTSILVNKLIEDIGFIEVDEDFKAKTGTKQTYELGFVNLRNLAKGLKKITFKCINRTDYIQVYEKQGEKIIRGLFELFSDSSFNNNHCLLPVEYRPIGQNDKQNKRLIIDYIGGMMDSYAISTYEKYFGKDSLERLYM